MFLSYFYFTVRSIFFYLYYQLCYQYCICAEIEIPNVVLYRTGLFLGYILYCIYVGCIGLTLSPILTLEQLRSITNCGDSLLNQPPAFGFGPRFLGASAQHSHLAAELGIVEQITSIIIAPYGGQEEMFQDLKSQVLPDQTIKYLGMVDGKTGVREV